MKRMRQHFIKTSRTFASQSQLLAQKIRMPLAIILLVFAIVFSVFRALTPWAKRYQPDVEQRLSQLLGQSVHIKSLETSWYWFHPVLKMQQVVLTDNAHHVLKISKLLIGIDVLSSLWHWQLQPGLLYIENAHFTFHQVLQRWNIEGLMPAAFSSPTTMYLPMIAGLLSEEKIYAKHVSADFYFDNNTQLSIADFNFKAVRRAGRYRLNGQARITRPTVTECTIMADVNLTPSDPKDWSGAVYVALKHVKPAVWQQLLPATNYRFIDGEGEIALWLDILHGQLQAAQAVVNAHDLAWWHTAILRKITEMQANIAYRRTTKGWRFTADHLNLLIDGVQWPENSLMIEYQQAANKYRIFLHKLLIKPLFNMSLPWPQDASVLQSMQPEGVLNDTQLWLTNQRLSFVLTKFTDLSFHSNADIPGVKGLSGVLYWQPQEGHLELDSENTTISPQHFPKTTFRVLNLAINWKKTAQLLRVNLERLALNNPQLLLNASGVLNTPHLAFDQGNLKLNVEFYAQQAQKILDYLPAKLMKDNLEKWLKQCVSRVDEANGRILINGELADFPFDNTKGEFVIKSHLKGASVWITHAWPLNKDIDAYLYVDKRNLDIDIVQGFLHNMPIDRVNLVLHDIGLGHEVLLMHGIMHAFAKDMKAYLFTSPLKDNMLALKHLGIKKPVSLDLSLDVPLYTERDEVFTHGVVTLDDNQAYLKGLTNIINIDKLSGTMEFNEHGITYGNLLGSLVGAPIQLKAKSDTKQYTNIAVTGEAKIYDLTHWFGLSLQPFVTGSLHFLGKLKIFDSPERPAELDVTTNFAGVKIDMPEPLGKDLDEITPLALKAIFNPEHTAVTVKYAKRLNAALGFSAQGALQQGEILLGDAAAILPTTNLLRVVGELPLLDVANWRRILSSKPHTKEILPLSLDLNIARVNWLDTTYPHVKLQAMQTSKDMWDININQESINAKLHYQTSIELLSGTIENLWLKLSLPKVASKPLGITIESLPGVDVNVQSLKIGDIVVGNMQLVGHKTAEHWLLDNAHITSPEYDLKLQGDWMQHNTTFEAELTTNNLSNMLERWSITPVVDAHMGVVTFHGSYPKDLFDFALDQLAGDLDITVKNGRISHLDTETESKLGLGKLLSILSLQTIPRRLKLDFSDLSEQGYSFDIFKGHFDIKQGVMTTKDSYIDGPVAYAMMNGDLDLSRRMYDLSLRITPYITASLPVVATIAGGPVAGVATWVASKIINKGMQKISGYTYKITGPWGSPVVEQVNILRAPKR